MKTIGIIALSGVIDKEKLNRHKEELRQDINNIKSKSQINENGERIYEQWRWYHFNGELAGISDSKGNKVEFDINGLPIK